MKDADEAVGKVLAGLREAEPSAGFGVRVERAAKERMTEGRSGGSVRGWRWVGVCCAAMLVVGVGLNMPRTKKGDAVMTSAGRAQGTDVQARREEVGALEEGVPRRFKPGPVERGSGTAELSKADSSRRLSKARGIVSSTRSSDIARIGVSFPAPPMSLTQEERLLLRVASHSGPEEVAMLDSSGRAMQDAAETSVFQDFFGKLERVEQNKQKVDEGESK